MTTSLSVIVSGTAYPLTAYGRTEGDWANVIGLPDAVDNALDLPGMTSLVFIPQVPKTRQFTVRLTIVRTTAAALNDSLIQLAGLLWTPGAPIRFRRIIPVGAGNQTAEADAIYLSGFGDESRPMPYITKLALTFRMLSPYWYDTTTSAAEAV